VSAYPPELELALKNQVAASVMSSPVITVTPDTPVSAAVELKIARRIKRLPVVDADHRLVGMVGRAALLKSAESEGYERVVPL